MHTVLVGGGWKSISLVDVYGAVSFTVWLCGCNLRCPFCHNWRLANNDSLLCRPIDVGRLLEDLSASRSLVDYLHVTGGEPLLQYEGVLQLFREARKLGVATSLNSNLTLYVPFKKLVSEGVLDHVATDIKVPFEELSGTASDALFREFLKSLTLVVENGIALELRVPVARGLTIEGLKEVLAHITPIIGRHAEKTVVVVNPLLSKPVTEPRDIEWCNRYCMPGEDELKGTAELFRGLGFKTVVKEVPR